MGLVIRTDGVDDAAPQPVQQRLPVPVGTQGRPQVALGIEPVNVHLGEVQVTDAGIRADRQPLLFCRAHQFHAAGAGQAAEMRPDPGLFDQ